MASVDELGDRITKDNAFFKSLVDLIPARVHFDKETKDEIQFGDLMDTTDVNDEDISPKKQRKRQRKHKNNGKPNEDPLESKSVTQLQEELDAKDLNDEKKPSKEKKRVISQDDSALKSPLTNLEELREKLHDRITILKGKRGQLNPEEWLEKKKLRRKQSKLKLKMKKKTEKLNNVKGDDSHTTLPNGRASSPVKPVYNKEGKIVFSKFDFADSGEKRKHPLSDLTGKDYKKILDNLDKRKEKLKQLKEKDVLAGRDLEKKSNWALAIGKAEGLKIKDDPALLKKALKRKEKRKEKTKKSWESREQQVEEKKKEKQDKRQKNIDLRKQTKFKNKMKKAGKRGRVVPGF